MPRSIFLENLKYFFGLTDGTYRYPQGAVGDLLKQAKVELEANADAARYRFLRRHGVQVLDDWLVGDALDTAIDAELGTAPQAPVVLLDNDVLTCLDAHVDEHPLLQQAAKAIRELRAVETPAPAAPTSNQYCSRYMDDAPGVRADCESHLSGGRACVDCPHRNIDAEVRDLRKASPGGG